MEAILVVVLTAIAFVAMLLLLATHTGSAGRVTGIPAAIIAVGGLLLYGYGYACTLNNIGLAVVRALLSTCAMFLGRNELSSVAAAPLMQNQWIVFGAWLLHLLALYITAGAAIVAVGTQVLKRLQLWLARRGQMNLIFGVNEDTLALGKQLNREKTQAVVFVGGAEATAFAAGISAAGCVLRRDTDADAGNGKFLNAIGMNRGKRKLTLYALSKDPAANLRYAGRLLETLKAKNIAPEQTRLVILCPEDRAVSQLQVAGDTYGYGYVAAVNEAGLAARLLMRTFPPCDHISFDENACASEDFECLVVGFGQTGQAVLKQLVMNGQFEGSRFRATVFDPSYGRAGGYFADANSQLLQHYEIAFENADGRSGRMYEYLHQQGEKLKYAVICTGSEKVNNEIAQDLCRYFAMQGSAVPVYLCSRQGVCAMDGDGLVKDHHKLYTPSLLGQETLDFRAMILNARYMQDDSKTPLQHWMDCDYFSRESSRASADFAEAMVCAAGKQPGDEWNLTPAQLLNLSKTEHHRWCAFHFCMGYGPMTEEAWNARAEEYRRQVKETGKGTIRISKNTAGRTHACLVSWEELVALGKKEAAVTGKQVDYQAMDTENVLAVPMLLHINSK